MTRRNLPADPAAELAASRARLAGFAAAFARAAEGEAALLADRAAALPAGVVAGMISDVLAAPLRGLSERLDTGRATGKLVRAGVLGREALLA